MTSKQSQQPKLSTLSLDRFQKLEDRPVPRSGLQAAELEYEDYGTFKAVGRSIFYRDIATRKILFEMNFRSPMEAILQLEFYRQMYFDVMARRAELHVIH